MFTAAGKSAAAGGAGSYIEDVFSTWLYTGNGASQTINGGVQATTSNTTASSIRSGSALANFFASGFPYGVFNSFLAGEYLVTDYGSAVSIKTVTYINTVGSDWAPTSVLIQYSSDNINWTTATSYSDNGSTSLQTISVPSGTARYWRLYQNTNTRGNSAGYEWHLGGFTMTSNVAASGLVWIKGRSGATDNALYDTARGATFELVSNSTAAQTTQSNGLTAFTGLGFTIGSFTKLNDNGATYASWTFREQAKFFDVVTYSNSDGAQAINHNLGSVPGCIIVKCVNAATNWRVYHTSIGNTGGLDLNSTSATTTDSTLWNNTSPTSTQFTVGTNSGTNIQSGAGTATYVAYLFAHNAGGFGATGTDNVISCGSYTGNGSATGPTITLGYEPQWLLVKRSSSGTGNWVLLDTMRGFSLSTENELYPNLNLAEGSGLNLAEPNATGFQIKTSTGDFNASGVTYIYIAIRRGPMKTPTSGTSVFSPQTTTATGSLTSLAAPDTVISRITGSDNPDWNSAFFDRLRGNGAYLVSSATASEQTLSTVLLFNSSQFASQGISSGAMVYYLLKRAPGFFDVVCYSGNGVDGRQIPHNLGVTPELAILKSRTGGDGFSGGWPVGFNINPSGCSNVYLQNNNAAQNNVGAFPLFGPATSTYFTIPSAFFGNYLFTPTTYVVYLFASCPGVSKVGVYTGTGALQTINCGFASGARFVFIKRTDSTGGWYVYDSARGITSGSDPYFFFNTTAAQQNGTNYVDTASTGFQVTASAPAELNANGGTYLFLAIA